MSYRIGPPVVVFLLGVVLANTAKADDPTKPTSPEQLAEQLGKLPGELMKARLSDDKLAERLFSETLKRMPTITDQKVLSNHLASTKDRESAYRDVLWALMNSKEFMKVHGFATFAETQEFSEKVTRKWEKK